MNAPFFSQAGFLQFKISFGDPAANIHKVQNHLRALSPLKNAVIALPELWAYGFDYENAAILAGHTPELLEKLIGFASEYDVILAGSLLEAGTGSKVFNTLYFVNSEGVLGKYQKQHLFSFWQETSHLAPGECVQPISSGFGKIGGLVCYDLRFPELAREQAFHGALLIVVSAEWPESRIDHWRALLQARAVENQMFVLACNSYGATGEYSLGGHSMIVGPDGTILHEADEGEQAVVIDLDGAAQQALRRRFCPPGERPRPPQDSSKHVVLSLLLERLKTIRRQQSRVAFTNGCFDILHSGHVAYLEKARSTADCLVVGLNSDRSVRAIKGDGRPVNSELERARVLSALACIDYVVIFDEETPQKLIETILPDVLVKGADWAEKDIVGAKEVREAVGEVVRIAFEHDVSTSALITRIQSQE